MVTMGQLRDATPSAWVEAARGWRNFALQSAEAGKDIRNQGQANVDAHWKDAVGQEAAAILGEIANEYDVASDLLNAVGMVLVGLGDAVEIAQRSLIGALLSASVHHLVVDEGGTTTPIDPNDKDAAQWKTKLDPVIHDAIRAATEADVLAAGLFGKLWNDVALDTDVTDDDVGKEKKQQALQDQLDASQAEVAMIRNTIPLNQSPEEVRAWWDSLSDKEREDLKRAVPVDLAGLQGIPDEV